MKRLGLSVTCFGFGLLLSCRAASQTEGCIADGDCERDGVFGRCVDNVCAYPSEDCDSGWKLETGECEETPPEDEGDTVAESGEGESSSSDGSFREDMPAAQCGAAIGSCDKADILIVIDNSSSTTDDELLSLVSDPDFVADLVPALTTDPCDVHVGVTTTEAAPEYQPEACQVLGALNRGGAAGEPDVLDCWDGGPPYFRSGDEPDGLLCAIAPGNRYDDNERQMQTVLSALGPELTSEGGCNEGFLRPDAKLLIVLITDEDDDDDSDNPEEADYRTGSPGSPEDWFESLAALKDPADLGFFAIMPTSDCPDFIPQPGLDDAMPGTAERAERLGLFANLFVVQGFAGHVEVVNLCQDVEDVVADTVKGVELFDSVCNGD